MTNSSDRIHSIFSAAVQRPPSERAEFVEQQCGDDPALRAQVKDLLAALENAGDFMSDPTQDAAVTDAQKTVAGTPRERVGEQIGRYKLLEQIGEGGFGTVWAAEQREPVKRRVALKIIKLGLDTKQVIARFEAERQALAMMDHPNIAKVLDAGSTETGRPFFVMELVKGVAVLDYCDTEMLDTKARLDLFTKVCHAIQHAHQKGIIHRDIKPSNVLVTLHDGLPVPKVIDFGIAKATNQELTEKTLYTQHRQMVGTPAYMSPEQAEMSGLDIDTRTDVYSLGVLLYELLTGTTPFDTESLMQAGYAEMMRIIREDEPHKPSTRASSLGETGTRTAEQRRADVRKLSLLLRGDLDWIVMKCLEKDRTRRYETVNGLAADIGRHLSDEPVVAGPPSAKYRLAKFVKRNRGQVIAGGVVAAALVLGVIGTSAGMAWALREKDRADTEANNAMLAAQAEQQARIDAQAEAERAERELARATEIKRLLTDMFKSADPSFARTADKTLVTRLLREAADRLDRGEISDELVAAEMHRTIGYIYTVLGMLPEAEPQARRAIEIYKRALGPDHFETRSAVVNLGLLCLDLQRPDEAAELFESLLRTAREELGERAPFTMKTMTNLGLAYTGQGRYADAEDMFLRALALKRDVLGVNDPDTWRCMNNLGSLYWNLGQYGDAEALFIEVFEGRRVALGEDHPETLGAAMNLGNIYRVTGQHHRAEARYLDTLDRMRNVNGPSHQNTLRCMGALAVLYKSLRRYDEAEPLFREALAARRDILPPQSHEILGAITNLGNLYCDMKRYEDALRMFGESVPAKREVMPGHPWLGYALEGQAEALRALGQDEEAARAERELVDLATRAADATRAPAARMNEAAWYLLTLESSRDPQRARIYAQRACDVARASGASELSNYLDTLARAHHECGDTDKAIEVQREVVGLAPDDPDAADRLAEYEAALGADSGDTNDDQ